MHSGRRTCSCKEQALGHQLGVDIEGQSLDLIDANNQLMDSIAYIRGMDNPRHTAIEPIRQAAEETGLMPPPSSESSSEESHEDAGDGDDESSGSCHGFSPSSEDEEEATDTARRLRLSSTRYDLLDQDHDNGYQEERPHAPPNTPTTTPPTDAARKAMPSEEEAPEEDDQEPSPKKTRSGRIRPQMPYKPRRYKGRRSR